MNVHFARSKSISNLWDVELYNSKLKLVNKKGDDCLFVPLSGDVHFVFTDEESDVMHNYSTVAQYCDNNYIIYKGVLYQLRGNHVSECLKLPGSQNAEMHSTLSVIKECLYCTCDYCVYQCQLIDDYWNVQELKVPFNPETDYDICLCATYLAINSFNGIKLISINSLLTFNGIQSQDNDGVSLFLNEVNVFSCIEGEIQLQNIYTNEITKYSLSEVLKTNNSSPIVINNDKNEPPKLLKIQNKFDETQSSFTELINAEEIDQQKLKVAKLLSKALFEDIFQ